MRELLALGRSQSLSGEQILKVSLGDLFFLFAFDKLNERIVKVHLQLLKLWLELLDRISGQVEVVLILVYLHQHVLGIWFLEL